MITSKKEFRYYLSQDYLAYFGQQAKKFVSFLRRDPIWRLVFILRVAEFFTNMHFRFLGKISRHVLRKNCIRLSVIVPINVFGPGLRICHYGGIVVADSAKVGRNCKLLQGVTIGSLDDGTFGAPIVGDNVVFSARAKVIGNIKIADGVVIGANAVVVRDIDEPNTSWGGVPARKLSSHSSYRLLRPGLDGLPIK